MMRRLDRGPSRRERRAAEPGPMVSPAGWLRGLDSILAGTTIAAPPPPEDDDTADNGPYV